MKKQEIDANSVIKGLINGFVCYGIICIFLCLLILSIGNYALKDFSGSTSRGLYITWPLMAVIILYFIIHFICRMSTYDVFKKHKTNPDNYKSIIKYLNIFFIICIILSMVLFLELLYLNLQYQIKSIDYATVKYKEVFSQEHIELLKEDMMEVFNESKINLTISTVILEIGVAISFISLISYQRKMITKYNEFN